MERRTSKLSAEERSSLMKAISQLPEVQASLIVLHYLHDHSLDEVAERLKLSHEEAAIHHHAALISLRRLNERYDGT